MHRIGTLARRFGLSRSTLLYYHRIGLLRPTGRTQAGYRLYSGADAERLASICAFRQAGLSIADIRKVLDARDDGVHAVLRRRLGELGEELRAVQARQRLLGGMLKAHVAERLPATVDKTLWIAMLRAAGVDEAAMQRWHTEFERRAPEAHHEFLRSLDISEKEALLIRAWSARAVEEARVRHLYEIFEDLPRQGPGCPEATRRMLAMVPGLPPRPRVLDLGCGSGAQTLVLLRELDGVVTALDSHAPFLDRLERDAAASGLGGRIRVRRESMLELADPPDSYDLLWAEGSLYILGVERALASLATLLPPGGCLAFTELTWLSADRPAEASSYWEREYPDMRDVSGNLARARGAGWRPLGHFPLPAEAWEEHYHVPMERRLVRFREEHAGDPGALAVADRFREEIDMYRSSRGSFGYVFYLLQKP